MVDGSGGVGGESGGCGGERDVGVVGCYLGWGVGWAVGGGGHG